MYSVVTGILLSTVTFILVDDIPAHSMKILTSSQKAQFVSRVSRVVSVLDISVSKCLKAQKDCMLSPKIMTGAFISMGTESLSEKISDIKKITLRCKRVELFLIRIQSTINWLQRANTKNEKLPIKDINTHLYILSADKMMQFIASKYMFLPLNLSLFLSDSFHIP